MLASPLTRRLRIRSLAPTTVKVGLGSNFSDYIGNADFASAWSDVQAQLTAEGYGPDSLTAKTVANHFADVYDNLASELGIDPATATDAAKQFIIAGQTVAGAVHTVEQIQGAISGGDPSAAFNILTGAMVAAATSTGLVTAGAGALITIGVSVAVDTLSKLGLFGHAPQGQEWCSGLRSTATPIIQVGCVATFGPSTLIYRNGSPYWRRFPKRSGGNTNDDWWFNAKGVQGGISGGGFNTVEWSGNPNGPKTYWQSYGNNRLIDSAFADFHYLSCQTVPKGLEGFSDAFTQAWTANKEYELNGLKSQPDWQVLRTLIGIWNRAHDGATYVDIAQEDKPYVREPVFASISNPSAPTFDQTWGPNCPSGLPALFLTLVDGVIGGGSSDPVFQGFYNASTNTLRIHTGPAKVVRKVIPLVLGVKGGTSARFTPAQTVALLALGSVAAVAAGGSVYAIATHQSVGGFWTKMWSGVVSGAKGLLPR